MPELSHEGRAGSVQYLAAGQHLWRGGPIWVDPMSPHSVDGKLRRIPQGAHLCSVRERCAWEGNKAGFGMGTGLTAGLVFTLQSLAASQEEHHEEWGR